MNKKISDYASSALRKSKIALIKVVSCLNRHKVITCIAAFLLIAATTIVGIGNHYLNKINYDDGIESTVLYTLNMKATTQPIVELVTLENGTKVFPDGSYITKDLTAVLSDGTSIFPDSKVIFQDGTSFKKTKIKVDSDGYLTIGETKLHISKIRLNQDGSVSFKDNTPISLSFISGIRSDTESSSTPYSFDASGESDNSSASNDPDGNTSAGNNTGGNTSAGNNTGGNTNTGGNKNTSAGNAPVINNTPTASGNSGGNNSTTKSNSGKNQSTTKNTSVTKNYEDSDEADQIIEDAKNNEKTADILKDNDKQIEKNIKNNKIWYNNDIVNILLMGIDNGSINYPYGRSDSMIVASINKKTKKVRLVSLARSAYVSIKGYPNTRLNHAHGYGGAALAMDTVERNYRIRIDNYISTNFECFKQLVDQLGGVDITLTKKEAKAMKDKLRSEGYTYIGAGNYRLNGETALYYVRLRKIDSDRQRTQRQRNVLTSIATRIQNMGFIEMNSLLNRILPLITTNLSKRQIVSQLTNVSSYLSNGIEQDVLPNKVFPLELRDGYEVMIVDWDHEVEYAHKLFYNGVTPSYKEG